MALPDKYENEPTVEVPEAVFLRWLMAKNVLAQATSEEMEARRALEDIMGNFPAATVNGKKVLAWRPTATYATARLISENAELVQHFMMPVQKEEFSLAEFKKKHPDIAARYQSRQFKAVE